MHKGGTNRKVKASQQMCPQPEVQLEPTRRLESLIVCFDLSNIFHGEKNQNLRNLKFF